MVMDAQARTALFDRVKNILLQPKIEWPQIAVEPATVGSIYKNYVVYLAAIPPLATFIHSVVFGYGFAGITYRPGFFSALTSAIVQYVLGLVAVYVFALIAEALAPSFAGQKDRLSAFKLAAYSMTASWVAGIFSLIPGLGILGILGLYSLYLFYVGAPVLMRVPQDKAIGYTAVIVIIAIVVSIVVFWLAAAISPAGGPPSSGSVTGKLSLPGGVTVDMSKLDQAAKRLEQASKQMEGAQPATGEAGNASPNNETANLTAIKPGDLKALLPATLPGGFAKAESSTSSGGAAGLAFGAAKGVYKKGQAEITLSLMDMGALGAFAALGGAFGANASEETANSYSKVGQVDGRTTVEEFNRETKSGKYGVMVSDRVMVEADGNGASMDALKAAVAAIDLSSVEALASK
jgi:hypothetical protein